MQLVGLAVAGLEEDPHGLGLDRDAPLPLELHRVEQLRPHQAGIDRVGQLEDPVRERRLAVVDMGDDAEVADLALVHRLVFSGCPCVCVHAGFGPMNTLAVPACTPASSHSLR